MGKLPLTVAFAFFLLETCGGSTPPTLDAGEPQIPAAAIADYSGADLYAAPWPDERLRGADGTIDMSSFPNPFSVRITDQLLALLEGAEGFGLSSTVYFPLAAPIAASSLPDVRGSLDPGASVFLIDVDPSSDERGTRWPVDASFALDPGPFGVPNLLGVLPLQGRPLRPERLYAAVITTSVEGLDGAPLEIAPQTADLIAGRRPDGLSDRAYAAHQSAVEGLRGAGVNLSTVAATAVFRTWDPTAALRDARAQVVAGPPPVLEADLVAEEVFDDYCVYSSTVRIPDFQGGTLPFMTEGGAWVYDASGALVEQRSARAKIWVTLPRRLMPADGFPTVVFVRTGGGGDRPLVDRGPRAVSGGEAIVPGSGPAMNFARAGVAGVSVDGPLGGLRNLTGWDEQFAIFNIGNPAGLRDNVRQSALELMHLTRLLPDLAVDASGCPDLTTAAGDGAVHLDTAQLGIMGHSMGATIAPLAVALEPSYRAMILSGAGASWIRNIMFKESPIAVRPAAENILRYTPRGRRLTEHDPVLALLQWAGEPADPQVYARLIVDEPIAGAEPRHVLMFQGILDTYIPPPIANPLTLALGLDLAGEELDRSLEDRFEPLGVTLDLAGGTRVALPVAGNRGAGTITALVAQHPEDGIEDGHEVVFQTAPPQLQYRCFLESLALGTPSVPPADAIACE